MPELAQMSAGGKIEAFESIAPGCFDEVAANLLVKTELRNKPGGNILAFFCGGAVGGMAGNGNKLEYKLNLLHKYYRCLIGLETGANEVSFHIN